MPNPNVFVENISSISPSREALVATPLKPPPQTITVNFQSGRSSLLDMSIHRSVVWAEIIDSRYREDKPIYIEIDAESNTITKLLLPRAVHVGKITSNSTEDIVEVELIISQARHFLRRSNPDFEQLLDKLQIARDEGKIVWVTDTPYDNEIIDVRQLPKFPAVSSLILPPLRLIPPPEPVPVTPQRAQQLFNLVNDRNCNPNSVAEPCIPFMYPRNWCWARAHEMCRLIKAENEQPKKIWIYNNLRAAAENDPSCEVTWIYHVAPILVVATNSGTEIQVIDPSLFSSPVPLHQWKRRQGNPNAILEEADESVYYRNQSGTIVINDPDYTQTKYDLEDARNQLKIQSSSPDGPPPYVKCLVPDIYLRDNLKDTGKEPLLGGGISASPDINHYRNELLDPQGGLGTPEAEAKDSLFETIEIGQENYIYLRLQNRGCTASPVDVDVYYALSSTLPTPGSWKLIDSFTTSNIAPGEFKVVGPMIWSKIPEKGHYCFIAVLGTDHDPKPDQGAIHTIDEFYNFIREHNNVVWKNFDTDDVFVGGYKKYDFWIQGWPRIAYVSDLEIDLSELPVGCAVQLRILKRLTEGAIIEGMTKTGEVERYTIFDVQPHSYSALCNIQLKTSDRSQATLSITLPETIPEGAYQLSILQKVDGKEMGRVTKRLIVGNYPYVVNTNSNEVHLANCTWVQKMLPKNRIAYRELELALKHGYNGCYYCLSEYDTG